MAYFYVTLFNKYTKDKHELTRLITHLSIDKTYELEKENIKNFKNKTEKDDFVFNIRVYNEWKVVGSVIEKL